MGGLSNAATYLAQSLAKKNEVHFFTRGDSDFEMNGVQYHVWRPYGSNILEYCSNLSYGLVERFRQYDDPKFDIIHFNDWHVTEALHLLQDRSTVFTYHSTEFGRNGGIHGDWWEYHEISSKEWYAGQIAKRCTAVSWLLRQEVLDLYKGDPDKIKVIPNGVVKEQFDVSINQGSIKEQYGIHPLAPLVVFIGRMVYQKGPDILVDAIPKIVENHWNARFIMAGGGGMRDWLLTRTQGMPVIFPGFISDSEYVRLLHASDIVVIPSRNEPFGIVLLEAWSANRPVVVSRVGGLAENVEHGINGLVVEPTPDGIAWGVNYYLDNQHDRIRMGRGGYNQVDRRFFWDSIADQMLYIYKEAS
ncbi:MAG TPA: glycosyltransferase family 4 protein [Methanospirillum sp.]|nr:glycosyltransferase family 4 protein [Methanospirillum sp.]